MQCHYILRDVMFDDFYANFYTTIFSERIMIQIQVRIGVTIHRIRTTTTGFFGGNTAKRQ